MPTREVEVSEAANAVYTAYEGGERVPKRGHRVFVTTNGRTRRGGIQPPAEE